MIKKIPFRAAINLSIIILVLIIAFHILVVLQIIPYTIVWGGRLKSVTEMLRFEMASIILNALLIVIITIKSKYLKINIPSLIINVVLWIFVGLFSLNSIGNLFAKMTFETVVFTPVTFILAILCTRIALERDDVKV